MPTTKKKPRRRVKKKATTAAPIPQPDQIESLVEDHLSNEQALMRIADQALPHDRILKETRITTPEQFDSTSVTLRTMVAVNKEIKAKADEILKPLNKARRAILDQKKEAMKFSDRVERHCRRLMTEWAAELRTAAMKEADKIAKRAEKRGSDQYAEDVRQVAMATPVTPDVQGVSTAQYVRGRVMNKQQLIVAIAAGHLPSDLVKVSQSELNMWAKANREHPRGQWGVESYLEQSLRVSV